MNNNIAPKDEINVVEHKYEPGSWLVEVIEAADGRVLQSAFFGTDAESRARDYALYLASLPRPEAGDGWRPIAMALKAWFEFQSSQNASVLYNAAHRYFGADWVNPDEESL